MSDSELLRKLLDHFFVRDECRLEWSYGEDVTLGDVAGEEVERLCLEIKRAADSADACRPAYVADEPTEQLEPGACPECLNVGEHKMSCSHSDAKGLRLTAVSASAPLPTEEDPEIRKFFKLCDQPQS